MANNNNSFGPPTKATPPFPQAGSAMPRQMPQTPPPATKQPQPPTGKPGRHAPKHKAGRTKHQ
jgi:hypothetical protein